MSSSLNLCFSWVWFPAHEFKSQSEGNSFHWWPRWDSDKLRKFLELGFGPKEAHETPWTRYTGEDALQSPANFWLVSQPHMPMGIQQSADPEQNCYSSWLWGFSPTFLNPCSCLLFFPPPYFVNPRRPPRCIFTFTPFLLILISADSLFPTYSQTNSHSLWTPLWMSSMIFLCDKLWELTPLWKTILEGIASKIISANLGQNVCWILI